MIETAIVQFLGLAMVCIGDSTIPPAELCSGCCTTVVWLCSPGMIYGHTTLSRNGF